MAYSTILGGDRAPQQPDGRDAEALGPSDRSDTGSDAIGTTESRADSDQAGTGERAAIAGRDLREGGDILPDQVQHISDDKVRLAEGEGFPEADPDAMEFTDLDETGPTENADPDARGDGRSR